MAGSTARRSAPLVPLSEVTDLLRRSFDTRSILLVWRLFRECDSRRRWELSDPQDAVRFFTAVLGPGKEDDAAKVAADCSASGGTGLDAVCRRLCHDETLRAALAQAQAGPPPGPPRGQRSVSKSSVPRARYVRLTPTASRDEGAVVQFGGLELLGPGGEPVRAARVTAVGARRTHADSPQNVLLAAGKRYRGFVHQPLLIELAVPSAVEGYRLQTADAADMDPTEWVVETSAMPAGPWHTVHGVSWKPARGTAQQADGHGLVAFRLSKQGDPQYDLYDGTQVELLQTDGPWDRVMLRGGLVGWVKSRNIRRHQPPEEEEPPLLSAQRWQWVGPIQVWTPAERRMVQLRQDEQAARAEVGSQGLHSAVVMAEACWRPHVACTWLEQWTEHALALEEGLRDAVEQEWRRRVWLEQRDAAGALAEVVAGRLSAAQALPAGPDPDAGVSGEILNAVECLRLVIGYQANSREVPLPQRLIDAASKVKGGPPLLAALGKTAAPWPPPHIVRKVAEDTPPTPDPWARELEGDDADTQQPGPGQPQLRGVSGRCSGCISTPAEAEKVAGILSQLYREKYPHGHCDVFQEVAGNLKCTRDIVAQAAKDLHRDTRASLSDAGLSDCGPAGALVLVLYTCEGDDIRRKLELRRVPQAIWMEVNAALRGVVGRDARHRRQASRELRRWAGFVSVLLTLRSDGRRPWHGAATFRGLSGLQQSTLRHCLGLSRGDWICWPAAASTTLDEGVADRDYHQQAKRSVIFEIRGVVSGIEAWRVSAYPKEREVLMPPFTALRVESPAQPRPDGRQVIRLVALGALGDLSPAITGFSPEVDSEFAAWLHVVHQSVLQC
eukprot:TRINITY_DN10171_c2_g1_i4.p1 TRINITY_DN10171_c2_g1~~TRINITY_DN10171_c2_g1_i4.p1  ORF type:complete len:840 (+),score=309.01 TRINITY_DN10171_c2_g1_i4:87-2606(+)